MCEKGPRKIFVIFSAVVVIGSVYFIQTALRRNRNAPTNTVREVTETAPLAFRFHCVHRAEYFEGRSPSALGAGRLKNATFRMTLTGPAISEIDVDASS